MRPNREQLAALLAVVDTGTFESAAVALHITPSAVSQRIKALESQVGRLVLVRSSPCVTTETGARLLRMARQIDLLEREAWDDIDPGDGIIDMPVAVNADSLATWFPAVFAILSQRPSLQLRLFVDDQVHTTGLIRSAAVLGAVTSEDIPVQGCSIERLGTMRYVPVATPELIARHSTGRGPVWGTLPVVRYNEKDDLQHAILARYGVDSPEVCHAVPSSQGFAAAVHAGLGWGALPEADLGDALETGRLRRLGARLHVDIPLYWQRWRLDSPALRIISTAVRDAARGGLRR